MPSTHAISHGWRRILETRSAGRGYSGMTDAPSNACSTGPGDFLDDQALIAALRAGDPGAPRALIERFQGVVFGLCLRMMGHRQDAEDVMQESFLRALRGISGFDGERLIRPWLLGIAANRCRTALALRARRPPALESAADTPDHRPGVTDPDDLAGELERALSSLRPEYRSVFALYHEQGLAYEEIAVSIDRPVGTVKTWLHRARAELAEILTRRGVHC
jgi:RNA polymerase sigma factor (sigma-70 family)